MSSKKKVIAFHIGQVGEDKKVWGCLVDLDKQLKVKYWQSDDSSLSVCEQIKRGLAFFDIDTITIIGFDKGVMGFDFTMPKLSSKLLQSSIFQELEQRYLFEGVACRYAYSLISRRGKSLKVRGCVIEESLWQGWLEELSGVGRCIDMISTVEVVGKRLYPELEFYKSKKYNLR